MKLNFGLQLEQTQKLIMTPELRQAIKILQLSSFELNNLIVNEIEKNPIIELSEEKAADLEIYEKDALTNKEEKIDWEKYFEYTDSYYYSNRNNESKDEEYNQENFVKDYTGLKEHLMFQLNVSVMDATHRKIGEYIIESIDSNGYLTMGIDEIAKILNESQEDVEKTLLHIQSFDPPGIAARNLQECLAIQLKQRNCWNEVVEKIIYDYLEELADNKFQLISKKLNVSCKEIQDVKDLIRTLEPKPGRILSGGNDVRYIIPDVYIEKIGDEYIVLVNDTTAPRLQISNFYKSILKEENKSSVTSKYLNEKLESAMWLIKSIEQRRNTLYNVVSCILEVQKDFFEKGVSALKPLTLKQIAEKLDIHESTVSRATNGKYVQTPKGIFELKYFFSSGIENMNGKMIASENIKNRIKSIISQEDPSKPVSDQDIVNVLKKENISISRRTVAKYRDEMGILSSSKRKRYS